MSKQTHLGTAILCALYDNKINQEKLAETMGSTQASVSRLISGKHRPSRKTMKALCSALNKNSARHARLVLIGHLNDEIESANMLLSNVNIIPVE